MTDERKVDEKMYARVFEGHAEAKLILEDLTAKFCRGPVLSGGIDGIRKSDFRAGARAVMEFIISQINRAHGVDDGTETTKEFEP